jgi:hypothetical protein
MANLYGGGYQDDLVRGPRRKALLDDMPDRPDGPSPTGGGGLPASPTTPAATCAARRRHQHRICPRAPASSREHRRGE